MNILLNYFFPITSITPTPAASTAFLKQVCVVGLPKDGGVTAGVITECTTITQVEAKFGSDASDEVEKLFDAGMTKVFVLPLDALTDLADAIEGHESDFFTILVSSDFGDDDIGSIGSAAVKAELQIQDLLFRAKTAGVAGNSTTINYNSGGTAGSEVVGVVGAAITVTMQDGVSTATQIKTAIDNWVPAAALVDVVVDSGDGSDVQAAFGAAVPLEDGADAVLSGDLDVGGFTGVVGVSSDDDDFLEEQAAIENRCAFHTTTTNKAKNMFYAFGKLLSNASDWKNQQFITMPLADDVETGGAADSLFDNGISFVISDDEFGERLSLFCCGGVAIVGPYIKRNLEIDMQSRALSYVSGNQPAKSKTQAALLEDELRKDIDQYLADEWITDGVVEVSLSNDSFVLDADVNIAQIDAIWRIFGQMQQTL